MKTTLPCEIIQDLLPSYADGLTSPVTGQAIEAHLEDCDTCSAAYARMTQSTAAMEPMESREVNFLKKKRKQSVWIVIGSLLSAVFLLLGGLFVGFFVVEREISPETLAYTLEEKEGNLQLCGYTLGSDMAVTRLTREQHNGVLVLHCKGTMAGLHHNDGFFETIPLTESLHQIRLGDRLIWADGVCISPSISSLYNARHAYIGDMPANEATAEALAIRQAFGSYTSELQTEKAPYEWTLRFDEAFAADALQQIRTTLRSDAYLMMATIDNLDAVRFVYRTTERELTLNVRREEAERIAGMPLHDIGKDPAMLQSLSNLLQRESAQMSFTTVEQSAVLTSLVFINDTDIGFQDMELAFYVDGVLASSTGGCNANESLIGRGEAMYFDIQRSDLGSSEELSDIRFCFSCTDESGKKIDLPQQPLQLQTHSQVFFLRRGVDGLELLPVMSN